MPTYKCNVCQQCFPKWKDYGTHCKQSGHPKLEQSKALVAPMTPARMTPEDAISAVIRASGTPMEASQLGTALKQKQISIPGKLMDFVRGKPKLFKVGPKKKVALVSKVHGNDLTGLQSQRVLTNSNSTEVPSPSAHVSPKCIALDDAIMMSNVNEYLNNSLKARLSDGSICSIGQVSKASPFGLRVSQEVKPAPNFTKTFDTTSSPQMLPPVRLPSGVSASVELVVDVDRARAIACHLSTLQAIALDCEGVNLGAHGELTLLQVAFSEDMAPATSSCCVMLFDVCALGRGGVEALKGILQAQSPIKVIHDVHQDAAALNAQFDIHLGGVFDTQLAHEVLSGKMLSSMADVLQNCGSAPHASKDEGRRLMRQSPDIWKKRPLHPSLVNYAALDVALLLDAWEKFATMPQPKFEHILQASQQRCLRSPEEATWRPLVFDKRQGYQMRSYELVCLELSPEELSSHQVNLQVQDSLSTLVALLPIELRKKLGRGNLLQGLPPSHELRDIILDLGQRPRAFFGHRKLVYLNDDPVVKVTQTDIDHVEEQLAGKFGPDNRAGIDGCLHRISAMRAKTAKIYGLTLRVGRAIFGNTNLITDLLLGTDKSILFLGTPGCGKTTIIREAARMLSEDAHGVVVVDTSNEICGDGLVPHPAVGLARRMMVPSLDAQAAVLIEAVQNHTPDIIVVDEIGRPAEVEAVQTVKERGVRILGSAHGDLRGLVKNQLLNNLVGGSETVTVGDAEARKSQSAMGGEFSKVRTQRTGTPVFDVVVELKPGSFHQWQVTTDVTKAVDSILAGNQYATQARSRDTNGLVSMELIRA